MKVRDTRLDAFVVREVSKFARSKQGRAVPSSRTDTLDRGVAALEAAESELAMYRDSNAISVIGQDAFLAGLAERQRMVDGARRELAIAQAANVIPLGHDVAMMLADPTIPVAKRHRLVAGTIDAVFVKRAHSPGNGTLIDERAWIVWRGRAPLDLPGRNGGVMRSFDPPVELGMHLAADGE